MNVSRVSIGVTGSDLLSMITEFVEIEGLTIENVELNDEILINGFFEKGLKINFQIGLKLGKVEDGKLFGQVSKVKIAKIGIPSIVRKLAMKNAVKSLEDIGVVYNDGKVIINIKKILQDVPHVDLNIGDIYVRNSVLNIEIKDIEVSVAGALIKEPIDDEEEETDLIQEPAEIVKVKDNYTTGRVYALNKLPDGAKKISDYLFILPDLVALIYRLLKDSRVPMKTKLIVSAAMAYCAFPTDFIPDKIPFIGKVDELAVVFFALNRIVNDVPTYILLENWEGKNDLVLVVKTAIEYATSFTKAGNVEKLYSVVEELTSL